MSGIKDAGFKDFYLHKFDKFSFINDMQKDNPDIVFNAMHGKYGEDGQIQVILNFMQIPYTHSGFSSSFIGMDKIAIKSYVEHMGFTEHFYHIFTKQELLNGEHKNIIRKNGFDQGKKFIIKPHNHGSSVGIKVVTSMTELSKANLVGDEYFLMEELISGREINVVILDDFGKTDIFEVIYPNEIYDFESKYNGSCNYIADPELQGKTIEKIKSLSERLYSFLGFKGCARVEMIVDEVKDIIFLLEINSHPGMSSSGSFVPKSIEKNNLKLSEFCKEMLKNSSYEKL